MSGWSRRTARFEPAVNLGNPHYVPTGDELLWLMERMYSTVVNLLGVSLDERPKVVSDQIRKLEGLRSDKGRPHWFVLDEAHHLFPSNDLTESTVLDAPPKTSLMITVHPEHVRKEALETVDIVMAVGKEPEETMRTFCKALGVQEPTLKQTVLEKGEALVWFMRSAEPFVVIAEPVKRSTKDMFGSMRTATWVPEALSFAGRMVV